MSDERDIERGQQAERIIKHELYADSWNKVREAILAQIEASPVRDKEGREYLYLMLKALNDARRALEQVMRDGTVAKHLQSEKRRFKVFG